MTAKFRIGKDEVTSRAEIKKILDEIRSDSNLISIHIDTIGRILELRKKIENGKLFILYIYSDTFDIFYAEESNKLTEVRKNFNSY